MEEVGDEWRGNGGAISCTWGRRRGVGGGGGPGVCRRDSAGMKMDG